MQRRTNLFYTTGDNSKFITFSNYTEALTGNFLATDWKMFPSKFICLSISELTSATKETFIKNVTAFYENKLAFLRDHYVNINKKVEDNIYPLDWLLKYLFANYPSAKITYIGEVTEHNYNSVYADTICSIDATTQASYYQTYASSETNYLDYTYSSSYLYGWYTTSEDDPTEKYTGTYEYANVKPKFDVNSNYLTSHAFSKITSKRDSTTTTISFNVIIPLFDLVNTNINTNANNITENNENTDGQKDVIVFGKNDSYINIPLGMWFADKDVVLDRDTATNYAPTWSLVLSSQFKPFPYSDKLQDESGQSIANDAYVTFAQVLSRQNSLITTFSQVTTDIQKVKVKIGEVEGKIGTLATTYTIDGIKKDLINYKKAIDNVIDINNAAAQTTVSEINDHISYLYNCVEELANNAENTISITSNGVYNVAKYGTAVVSVNGGVGSNGLQIGDIYTQSMILENSNTAERGKYRNIYFTLNADKEGIWDNKDNAYVCLYKYRGRRSKKNKDFAMTSTPSYFIEQHRYCMQNDAVITDDNIKLYCWCLENVSVDTRDWNYFYTEVPIENSVKIFPETGHIFVHRNSLHNDIQFTQPCNITDKNNYATLINNLVEYTFATEEQRTALTSQLVRKVDFDINQYVNVIAAVPEESKDEPYKKLKQIMEHSWVNRKIKHDDDTETNIYNYNCYADDFRIVPTLLGECGVLVLTKDITLTSGYTPNIGDVVTLNDLTKEQFLNDTLFQKVILVMPWNTYHIIMRYYKKDNCAFVDRAKLVNNLRERAKGGSSQKLLKHSTLPLQFGICTYDDIVHGKRPNDIVISKKLAWSLETVVKQVNDTYTYSYICGTQHIL